MIPQKRARGRPKGTGLNDFVHLKAIAGLLNEDPNLRPTTAIRQLGIQDPSVIRRLRDKFHACETELMSELRAAARDVITASHRPEPAPVATEPEARTPTRAIALTAIEEERISQPLATLQRMPPAPAPAEEGRSPGDAGIEIAGAAKHAPLPIIEESPLPRRQRPPREVALPSETKLPEWLGVGLSVYAISMEAHFAVVGTLFEWPPLAAVLRTQVAYAELVASAVRPGLFGLDTAFAIKT